MIIENGREGDLEIVIGFTAPIGTNLDTVIEAVSSDLRSYAYEAVTIRLSEEIGKFYAATETSVRQESYYSERMNQGDKLRLEAQSGDAVAALAIMRIMALRDLGDNEGADQKRQAQANRKAWLLRTIKHDEEVELLRAVYGDRFILVGVSQTEQARRARLRNELRDQSPNEPEASIASTVEELIARDDLDQSNRMGQRVSEAYALSDYFVNADGGVKAAVDRLIGLLFGAPFITPTRDEFAMYLAFGASLRSSDPGRQVGAVITSAQNEIIAVGVNEVPKAGGGEYWVDDHADAREFQTGHDFNKRMSHRAINELLEVLGRAGHLSDELESVESGDRIEFIKENDGGKDFSKSRLMSLIEFGRIVHAEMSAITQAARSASSIAGGTLYATTFPCHMCMRLIISSGISKIVYVDPYSKSLAFEMYPEALGLVGDSSPVISIQPFQGVSQRQYVRLFVGVNRRRDPYGKFVSFIKADADMRLAGPDSAVSSAAMEDQIPIAFSERVDKGVVDAAKP